MTTKPNELDRIQRNRHLEDVTWMVNLDKPSLNQPRHYRITIQGHLHPRWSEWFENLTISQQPDGTTTLPGLVVDQAALYGLIIKLRDMGLPLLAIQSLAADKGK